MAKRLSDMQEFDLTFDERWELEMAHRNGMRYRAYWERYADGEVWVLRPVYIEADYSEGDYSSRGVLEMVADANAWADEHGFVAAVVEGLDGTVEVSFRER